LNRLKSWPRFNLFLIIIAVVLCLVPFVTDSRTVLILLTQVFIFAVFAMSYDLLLGYTGIVSFGHAMFFGIGAYVVSIGLSTFGASLSVVVVSIIITIVFTAIVSFLVGILTLRLKSHFFAMLTLAVSSLFLVVAEKWRSVTKGGDGFTFSVPDVFRDRVSFYFIAFVFLIVTYLFLTRFTESPLGRVLQAVRENEPRVESLGYHVIHYKVIANVIAGIVAGLAGLLYALSLKFVNTAVFSVDVTLDALLMTIIGGVGTLFGAIVGATLIEFAKHGLMDLAKMHWIFERWIILFGTIFIIAVMFFPKGIVGTIKDRLKKRAYRKMNAGTERENELINQDIH